MFQNVMNKFSKFINGNDVVADSDSVLTVQPVPEVSYPFVTDLINNGQDYVLSIFIKDANSFPISGYPVEDLGGDTSREVTLC